MPRPRVDLLSLWAMLSGLFLWVPALAVPGLPLPLQPMDLWVVAGLPLAVLHLGRLGMGAGWVGLTFVISIGLSTATGGAQPLILGHALILALGFMVMMAAVAGSGPARRSFLSGFLMGSAFSVGLFLVQYGIGAQRLDFRTNLSFSLPAQYGRGFGLFPEVSTFATHSGMALAMVLALLLHPSGGLRYRWGLIGLAGALLIALMLSRSTSLLVITPVLCLLAVTLTRRIDAAAIVQLALASLVLSGLLALFFTQFYADRLETAAASRSAAMRLASVLGGLSPLWTGEVFGVGLGENHQITRRAFDIGRALDLSFGQLPQGVNSQVIGRIFEEGWPAVLHFAVGLGLLFRVLKLREKDPATTTLCLLAIGSFLSALMVTGYRGIYTNWLWLALPAGLLVRNTSFLAQRLHTSPAQDHPDRFAQNGQIKHDPRP